MSKFLRAALAAAPLLLVPAVSAQNIVIQRDTVVPVVFEDEINLKESRRGDRFIVGVDRGRDLPYGTTLEGRIIDIRPARGKDPAHIDLEFHSLILPNGRRHDVRAVPISLDHRGLSRDRDGRITARRGPNSDQFVIGGVVGGFVLGSLIKKPFEGAFVGALAGIIMAEANKKQNDVAIKRGTRMGALFERDLRISYDGRWDGDYRRNDEWNRNDDYRRDDDWNRDDDWRRDDDWQRQDEWRREDYQRTDEWRQDPYGREIEVKYGNRILRFARNEAPYRLGGTVMVPLERTAAQLGLDVSKSAGGRTILVEDEESLLKLEQDSADFRLNGRRGTLPRNVVSRDGVIYVPVEALAQMKREFVYVNGSKVGNSA